MRAAERRGGCLIAFTQSRCAAANLPAAAQRAAAAAALQLLLARAQDGAGAALAREPWLWNFRFLQVAHVIRL